MNIKFLSSIKQIIRPHYYLWVILIAMCWLLDIFNLSSLLRFDRDAIELGQWYRLITAHFVHLNEKHLYMNMLGAVLVMMFFSTQLKIVQWINLVFISSIAVSLGLFLFNSELKYYVGLSGVLHALFIVGAVTEVRRFPLSGWLLLAVLLIKLGWEQINGAMPGSESFIHGRVVVDSHLYGAIAGGGYLLVIRFLKKTN